MRKQTVTWLCLIQLALVPAWSSAADDAEPLELHAVESATTPADHMTLAEYYRAKAADAQAEAKRHESMGRAYTQGKLGTSTAQAHCKRLSEQNSAIAAEYEALAKLHEGEAKKAK